MGKVYTVHSGRKTEVRDYSYQYLGYYLIDGLDQEYVFSDFKRAVSFCEENGLDPNKDIQTNSPEVYTRCKEIALRNLKELDITKNLLQTLFDQARDECDRMDKEIKALEERLKTERSLYCQVELDVQKENRIRQTGVVHGIYEAMKALEKQREPYWKITYNCPGWRKR